MHALGEVVQGTKGISVLFATLKLAFDGGKVGAVGLVHVFHAQRYLCARHCNDFDPDLRSVTGIWL